METFVISLKQKCDAQQRNPKNLMMNKRDERKLQQFP